MDLRPGRFCRPISKDSPEREQRDADDEGGGTRGEESEAHQHACATRETLAGRLGTADNEGGVEHYRPDDDDSLADTGPDQEVDERHDRFHERAVGEAIGIRQLVVEKTRSGRNTWLGREDGVSRFQQV